MPTVAIIEGVRIRFFFDEHPPPHFQPFSRSIRLRSGWNRLVFSPAVCPRQTCGRVIVGGVAKSGVVEYLVYGSGKEEVRKGLMKDDLRITSAEAVLPGVLKLAWNDGYEGIVDLRGKIAEGEAFEPLRDAEEFKKVRVADYGHYVFWGDEDDGVDFGCDRLREIAEEQAALLARAN
jgi:hypothetical protein